MLLDHPSIVIRERDHLDICDLSLHVIRDHAGKLSTTWAMGAVPAIALNTWFFHTMNFYAEDHNFASRFPLALYLMIWEMPWVTALMTAYLGRAIFGPPPRLLHVIRDVGSCLGQLLWYQGIVRGLLLPWGFTWFWLFTARPFTSEVILLERNPLFNRQRTALTTRRRNAALHAGSSGEFFGRWLATLGMGGLLLISIGGSLGFIIYTLFAVNLFEDPTSISFFILLQVSCWLVVGFFAVVRFLSYLDLRIRREGWEVEFLLRAEEARLRRQPV